MHVRNSYQGTDRYSYNENIRGTSKGFGTHQNLDYGSGVRIHVGAGRQTGHGSEDDSYTNTMMDAPR